MQRSEWTGRLPWSIVVLAVLLIALGCLGIAHSQELWGGSGRHLQRQLMWIPICLAGDVRCQCPQLQDSRALELCGLRRFAAIVGRGLLVPRG